MIHMTENDNNTETDTDGTEQPDTKYGGLLAEHEWSDPEAEKIPERTRVKSHKIVVYYDAEPDPEGNYGREKYTLTISYDNDTGDPYVLHAVEHRWKGNYWRDVTDWDWLDLPDPVRQCTASSLPVESVGDLNNGVRLVDEGGESRWEKHHKHRVEAMSGDEMWGTSFLRDGLEALEAAAEAFNSGSEGKELSEELVSKTQQAIESIDGRCVDTDTDRSSTDK